MAGQKKLLFLLVGVILLVTILVLLSLFTPRKPTLIPTPPPTRTPTIPTAPPIPSPTPLPKPDVASKPISREKFIGFLPVESEEFKIEYFATSDSIVVTITKSPLKENTAKSKKWLNDLGITDFKRFNITWVSSPYVY